MAVRPLEGATGWLNGGPVDVTSVEAPALLVHFFAASCPVCEGQLPEIAALRTELAPRGLVVVGVHTPSTRRDRDPERAEAALRAAHLEHPIALDARGAVADAYDVAFVPSYFVFDATRTLRHFHAGHGALVSTRHAIEQLLDDARATRAA
jgi:peroxiredoxin